MGLQLSVWHMLHAEGARFTQRPLQVGLERSLSESLESHCQTGQKVS